MENIVVRAPNWLGDVIMTLPLLEALARVWPEVQVHIVIKPEHVQVLDLLPPSPKRTVWPYNRRQQKGLLSLRRFCHGLREKIRGRIDYYLALPPSFSSAVMGVFLGAGERVGYPSNQRGLLLTRKAVPQSGLHRARKYLRLLQTIKDDHNSFPIWQPQSFIADYQPPMEDYLVLNPNSQAVSRTLPREKWVELLEPLSNTNFVLTGAPAEAARTAELCDFLSTRLPQKNFLSLAGKTDMLQLFKLLQASKGMISNDSGPAHVAHMLGVPLVVFFGAGDYQNTGPGYAIGRAMVLNSQLECSPCLRNECPLGTLDCLARLTILPSDIEAFFLDLNDSVVSSESGLPESRPITQPSV